VKLVDTKISLVTSLAIVVIFNILSYEFSSLLLCEFVSAVYFLINCEVHGWRLLCIV